MGGPSYGASHEGCLSLLPQLILIVDSPCPTFPIVLMSPTATVTAVYREQQQPRQDPPCSIFNIEYSDVSLHALDRESANINTLRFRLQTYPHRREMEPLRLRIRFVAPNRSR